MPAASSTPHRFNRFEIKYVAELSQAAAVRAELPTRADRPAEPLAASQEAIARCPNDTERRHLAPRPARL